MATAYLETGTIVLGRKPLVARLFEELSVAWRLFESAIEVSRAIESLPPSRQRDLVLTRRPRETIEHHVSRDVRGGSPIRPGAAVRGRAVS